MQPAYIISASAISPQHSFDAENFLQPVESSNDGKLFAVDAPYNQYINPVAIRRMSRLIKMGISAAMQCLKDAGVSQPDAIITGTGRGSMGDMEHFITDMLNLQEQALNPTYFIQSTYNSINGWVALQSKCIGYAQTYVHRGLSLEMALFDAQLLLMDKTEPAHLLVGCFDELTKDYFVTKQKIGYWKKDLPPSLELLQHNHTPGTIAGEGVAFFTISNQEEKALCSIQAIDMLQDADPETLLQRIDIMLQEQGIGWNDIDVLLSGMNGDARHQPLYNRVYEQLAPETSVAVFKHLSGEYDTCSGFAVWLATKLFKDQAIPGIMLSKKGSSEHIKYILLVNHYIVDSVSVMLLKQVN